MGRTETDRWITNEPCLSAPINKTTKEGAEKTLLSEWRSVLKRCLTGPTSLEMSGKATTHPRDLAKPSKSHVLMWLSGAMPSTAKGLALLAGNMCFTCYVLQIAHQVGHAGIEIALPCCLSIGSLHRFNDSPQQEVRFCIQNL